MKAKKNSLAKHILVIFASSFAFFIILQFYIELFTYLDVLLNKLRNAYDVSQLDK